MKVFGPVGEPYQFQVLNYANASTLTLGTAVSATLNNATSTQFYKFSGTAGQAYYVSNSIVSTTDTSGNGGASWLSVVDQYGVGVLRTTLNSDGGRITLPNSGTYTVVVEGYTADVGTTDFTFNVKSTSDTTTALTLGTKVTSSISTPGQQKNYTFTLGAPAILWFDSQSNDSNVTWQLTGPTGVVPTYSGGIGLNGFHYDDQSLGTLPAGAYTLTVSGQGATTDSFAFNLMNLANAVAMTPGTAVNAVLNPGNSTQMYQFTGAAGESLYLSNSITSTTDVSGQGGLALTFLIDQYGRWIFSGNLSTDAGRIILPNAGTYTFVVNGRIADTGTTNYTFNAKPTSDTTTALALNSNVSANISSPGQVKKYTFTLAVPGQL